MSNTCIGERQVWQDCPGEPGSAERHRFIAEVDEARDRADAEMWRLQELLHDLWNEEPSEIARQSEENRKHEEDMKAWRIESAKQEAERLAKGVERVGRPFIRGVLAEMERQSDHLGRFVGVQADIVKVMGVKKRDVSVAVRELVRRGAIDEVQKRRGEKFPQGRKLYQVKPAESARVIAFPMAASA